MLRYKDILLRSDARQREKRDVQGSGAAPILGAPPADPTVRACVLPKSVVSCPSPSQFPPLSSSSSSSSSSPPSSTRSRAPLTSGSLSASASSLSVSMSPHACKKNKSLLVQLSIVLPTNSGAFQSPPSSNSSSPSPSPPSSARFTPRKIPARVSPQKAGASANQPQKQIPPCKTASQQQSPLPKPSPRITPRKISTPRASRSASPHSPQAPPPLRLSALLPQSEVITPPNAGNTSPGTKSPAPGQAPATKCRLFDDSDFPLPCFAKPPAPPSPPASPPPACAAAMEIKPIKSLKSLLWCDFPPGSFVMLDLDETLVQTRHSPALLLSTYGARFFKGYVQSNVQGFKARNAQIQKLQEALKDKVLVEGPITTNTIKELQSSGCWVFGLTTRYSSMADATTEMLQGLGIDLASVAPFPPTRLEDPMTGAVVANGVVYCNGFNKGFVLNRILENVVFGASLRILRSKGAWNPPKVVAPADTQHLVLPPLLVLVDDVRANLDSMVEVNVAKMLRIPVAGFHFTPPRDEHPALLPPPEDCRLQDLSELALKLLMLQMEHLVVHGLVLSNSCALTMLQERDGEGDSAGKAEVIPLNP